MRGLAGVFFLGVFMLAATAPDTGLAAKSCKEVSRQCHKKCRAQLEGTAKEHRILNCAHRCKVKSGRCKR